MAQHEHAVLLTGIGGQGVQLAAQALARAAVAAGLDVQLFGSYEGMMRGGATQATVIVAAGTVEAPPTVHRADAAVVLHHEHAPDVVARVAPGGLLVVNTSVVSEPLGRPDCALLEVPAGDVAQTLGHVMTASMVMVGALAGATGLVTGDQLALGVADALPSYRQAHVARNVAAVEAGLALGAARPHALAGTAP